MPAPAQLQIKKAARRISVVKVAGFGILQFCQATPATPVTQGFPFRSGHFFEGFALPKWFRVFFRAHFLSVGNRDSRMTACGHRFESQETLPSANIAAILSVP